MILQYNNNGDKLMQLHGTFSKWKREKIFFLRGVYDGFFKFSFFILVFVQIQKQQANKRQIGRGRVRNCMQCSPRSNQTLTVTSSIDRFVEM